MCLGPPGYKRVQTSVLVRRSSDLMGIMGKAKQIVLRPAEQWRDEQVREVEVVERLDRVAHRREQILHRERLRQRESIDPRDRHVPRLQPRDDPRREVAAAADEDQYVARRDASPVLAMFDPVLNLVGDRARQARSEEHTSELQSLMRNSYAVFCLKKKK